MPTSIGVLTIDGAMGRLNWVGGYMGIEIQIKTFWHSESLPVDPIQQQATSSGLPGPVYTLIVKSSVPDLLWSPAVGNRAGLH